MTMQRYDSFTGIAVERDDGDFVRVDDLLAWIDQEIAYQNNLSIRKHHECDTITTAYSLGVAQ